jgi:type I restriction enzyme S subunit
MNDICRVIDCEHKTAPTEESGIPSIRTPNIGRGRLILQNVNRVSQKTYKEWTRRAEPEPGDLIMAREAPVGNVAIVPRNLKVCLGQRTVLIKPDKQKVSSEFLNYLLNSSGVNSYLLALSNGATVEHLNVNDIRQLLLPLLPPLPIQRKIAAILSAYDDLIENNNRRIAILEKIAEEIYREWFVRMRFPGHEKVKFHKGVPEGWEVRRIDSLGKVITGKTPSTNISKYFNGNYLFIKTPDMHGNMFVFQTEETLTEDGLKSQNSQTIPPDSIAVSCIGTGGVVSVTTSTCQTNQQINSIVLKTVDDLEWAFFTIRNLKETISLFGATGATMTNLSKGKLCSIKVFLPNKELRKEYHRLTHPLFDQIKSLMFSNIKLRNSRDLLLSRLITGKLSVEDLDIKFPPSMRSPEPVEGKEADV